MPESDKQGNLLQCLGKTSDGKVISVGLTQIAKGCADADWSIPYPFKGEYLQIENASTEEGLGRHVGAACDGSPSPTTRADEPRGSTDVAGDQIVTQWRALASPFCTAPWSMSGPQLVHSASTTAQYSPDPLLGNSTPLPV